MLVRAITAATSVAALVAGGASASALTGGAESPACSVKAMKGGYGFNGSGYAVGQPGAFLGTMLLDGAGAMTGTMTLVAQAPAVAFTLDLSGGSYSVGPDCRGRVEMPFRPTGALAPAGGNGDHSHNMAIVVTDGGARIIGINDDVETTSHVPLPGIASMSIEAHRL